MEEVLTKDINGKQTVVDVDTSKRTTVVYFSKFDKEFDTDGDIVDPSAFDDTLKAHGPSSGNRVWHLWNHSFSFPINKPHELGSDGIGLRGVTKFPNTTIANDLITLYQEGALTEHSFGYNVLESKPITINGVNGTLLTKLRLWEGSSVLWGANKNSNTIGLKGLNIDDVATKSIILDKLLHNGNLSDETFLMIEQLLKDIKAIFSTSKENSEGNTEEHTIKEPASDPEGLVLNFYKLLNQ